MKKRINIIKSVTFISILIWISYIAGQVFINKTAGGSGYNYRKWFYASEDNYDVIFVGASKTRLGISPMELWNSYGITSYLYSQGGAAIINSYWSIESILKETKPQIIIVGLDTLGGDYFKEANTHSLIDAMPIGNAAKYEAMLDMAPTEKWCDYLFPLAYYHERWQELTIEDFKKLSLPYNNGGQLFKVNAQKNSDYLERIPIVPESESTDLIALDEEYIEKIINLCQKESVELILCYFPWYTYEEKDHGEEYQKMANTVNILAEQYGITYVNFMHLLDDLNWNFRTDMNDRKHSNISGTLKLTMWMGDYLTQNYLFEDKRSTNGYQKWNRQYDDYLEKIENYLKGITTSDKANFLIE